MSGVSGRFVGRNPISYSGNLHNLCMILGSSPLDRIDPSGLTDLTGTYCDFTAIPPRDVETCLLEFETSPERQADSGAVCCEVRKIACAYDWPRYPAKPQIPQRRDGGRLAQYGMRCIIFQ